MRGKAGFFRPHRIFTRTTLKVNARGRLSSKAFRDLCECRRLTWGR